MSIEESVDKLLTEQKVRFGTHKKKKAFIKALIQAVTSQDKPITSTESCTTVLVKGKKESGQAILVPSDTEKHDDFYKARI